MGRRAPNSQKDPSDRDGADNLGGSCMAGSTPSSDVGANHSLEPVLCVFPVILHSSGCLVASGCLVSSNKGIKRPGRRLVHRITSAARRVLGNLAFDDTK